MQLISLGIVTVAAAGTPTKLSTVLTSLGLDSELKVSELYFKPLAANTGLGYVGLAAGAGGQNPAADFSKSTGVGLLRQLSKPSTTDARDHAKFCAERNVIRVADFAVDVAVSGEGFVVYAQVN